jgi:hypothetical protein
VSAVPTPATPELRTTEDIRTSDLGERFAAHVGVQVDTSGDGSPCDCGATATLTAAAPWLEPGQDDGGTAPVPTGAVLALVDAVARHAAGVAVAESGHRVRLDATAMGIQFRAPAAGPVTATASVPCEGVIADRADERGSFRFSVAIEVVDDAGERVATGTVQWRGHLDDRPAADDG